MEQRTPVIFLSHGGGPWPWVKDMREHFRKTEEGLKELGKKLKPRAIISISAHWEEENFTVSSASKPGLIYDYYGFPENAYHLSYPAPGDPSLAGEVQKLIGKSFLASEDRTHGFDHGTFVPLALMFPDAHIPVVSLSLRRNLDAKEHIDVGRLLSPLREEGVLIMGSGLTYHNLRAFFRGGEEASRNFEGWLTSTVSKKESERNHLLSHWTEAPDARKSHPREDHLLPLMMISGAAGDDIGKRIIFDQAFGVSMASYSFGHL